MHDTEEDFSFTNIKRLFFPLTTIKIIHFIILIGIIVFFNASFNAFIFDDDAQIITNQSVHSIAGISDIVQNTMHSVFTSDYYRPFPFIIYAVIYNYFQENSFPFHVVQLFFHITNAVLIFLIFKKYLKEGIAFFLSILFLIHPINEAAVVYLANLQDVLFVFFGLLATLLLQRTRDSYISVIFANICLLCSLFSKETGILFFLYVFLFVIFYKKPLLRVHIVLSFFVGCVYLLARLHAHVPLQKDALEPIMTLNLWQRMLQIPAIILYYVHTFVFPKDLILIHTWVIRNIDFSHFFLPLLIDSIVLLLLISMAIFAYTKSKEKKIILFSSLWLFAGLLVHVQLISLDFTVSDHFF